MISKLTSGLTAATLLSAAVTVTAGFVTATGASAATSVCTPDYNYYWTKGGNSYRTIGPAAGEHNSGSSTIQLDYSETATTSESTSVSAGASFSVDAGIAEVKADLNVSVTKSYTKGRTVASHLAIPGHDYGYLQPKAEFTTFTFRRSANTPHCGTNASLGTLTGITAVPFFASCVATTSCTPKP